MADYSRWTKEALVRRVQQLEQDVAKARQRPAAADTTTSTATATPKAKKSMDPSRYASRFIALKLAYLGKRYGGFEYQPSGALPTIEEELWKALTKACLVFPAPGASADEVDLVRCEYSKCGRTDRGVSAFGQVVALRVRSNKRAVYAKVLNRLLPPDIRVLAWCATPPADFSARFSCRERQYRYFFTQPAYFTEDGSRPGPTSSAGSASQPPDGWLDIDAMRDAATRFVGLHDFRNFCKVDPSKQITNFERRIFAAGITEVADVHSSLRCLSSSASSVSFPRVYSFDVRGSAFLWHQIRHMVAVLFLVGQGREPADVVSQLLGVAAQPGRPNYPMADETPLVLWDCIFPPLGLPGVDDSVDSPTAGNWSDSLQWLYVGHADNDDAGEPPSRMFIDGLWRGWRTAKMDEILANRLLDLVTAGPVTVAESSHTTTSHTTTRIACPGPPGNKSHVFEGGDGPRLAGIYVPLLKRPRLAAPDDVNDRYARQKGFDSADAMRQTGNWRAAIKARKEEAKADEAMTAE
ncbi:pseudouridylate synthase 3 [Grosmannia clavigera kw1407]|uniref:Pseudouridylate synthase 3 n=1 Tax=Grosmannia clavigera (strain kw1407 / UAMH 11150) TaxID=655863 RepID=F0XDE3_GROCL|nr:pseudouridylate synthase 3 [Grosmannia clavigera kw1407]EFX04135.1 pseudouridylate synthase 3 [Grosmannia clavigera kw1407]